MTKEELAQLLHGRQYREEITPKEARLAKDAGLLVVFGASDDLTEFRGVIYDEAGAWEGATHKILNGQLLSAGCVNFDEAAAIRTGWTAPDTSKAITVKAAWCPDGFPGSWLISTDAPHATFDILEDGELYCRGVVIDMREAEGGAP